MVQAEVCSLLPYREKGWTRAFWALWLMIILLERGMASIVYKSIPGNLTPLATGRQQPLRKKG